jgi:hypothetical protein
VQTGSAEQAGVVRYMHNALGQRVFKSDPQPLALANQTPPAPSPDMLGQSLVDWLRQHFGWLFTPSLLPGGLATPGQSFVYAAHQALGGQHLLLGEYGNGGSQGAGRSEYLWLPRPGGEAELIGVYRGGRVYSAHTDMLGTPRQLKDDKGQLVWQWAYSAYGDNKPMGLLRSTSKPGQAYASSAATRWLRATPALQRERWSGNAQCLGSLRRGISSA